MQSKLVENWLTNAKELSFTAPFVQLLIQEGYKVIQSRGGPTEQGKDIIAYDPNGELCCFQLKCGDIGGSEWQKYRAQFDDLTEIPPKHTTLIKTPKSWRCYLVTNGDIKGNTAQTIIDYSAAKTSQKKMPLQTITKDELLRRFADAFGDFLPIEPNDIRIFFELYCESGDNTLKRKDFKQYFERYFFAIDSKSKQKKIEAIHASLILTSYLLTNKYIQENDVAILDAWILLILTILYFADKWDLKDKDFRLSEELILNEFDEIFKRIINDTARDEHNLVDSTYGLLSEPFMTYRVRCAELLGYISACINYCKLSGRTDPKMPQGLPEKVKILATKKMLISEGAMPFLYNVVLSSELNNSPKTAVSELVSLVEGTLLSHDEETGGLISPYYTTTEVISHILGKDEINESFQNRSYTLWPAILLLAKNGQREYLNKNWAAISQISMQELVAEKPNDLLLWDIKEGDLIDNFPNGEQSWSKLLEEANTSYDNDIPTVLLKRKYLIPFMLIAMPHRLSPKFILALTN